MLKCMSVNPFDAVAPIADVVRNEAEDMQKAMGYLYEFKQKLDELHPNCLNLVEHMLQSPKS